MSQNKGGPDYIFEKTQEIKKIKTKQSLNKKLMILTCFSLVILGFLFYLNSSYSKIRYINITGNDLISEKEVLESINIKEGDFKLLTNTKEIKNHLLDLTLCNDCLVNIDINGNLNIYIDEKKPLMYWISDNVVKVLLNDKTICDIDNNKSFKWLLNIPQIYDITEEDILNYMYDSYTKLDLKIVANIIAIKSYPLSYDEKNIVLYFNDDNYVLCNMSQVDKANDYYQILTKLKVNNSCIFFDTYSNNGYSSSCPWEIDTENIEDESSDDIIINEE